MNYTSRFPLLERLAPDSQSRSGIAWRLYWLWPQLRLLNLFALVAWIVAMLLGGLHLNLEYFTGAQVLGPVAFVLLLHLLFLGFLGSTPGGGYALGSSRALAMLPVNSTRLRDAVWFVDVPSASLVYCVACLLPLLIVPLPLQFRLWLLAAATVGSVFYAGCRASMSLISFRLVHPRPRGLREHFASQIPLVTPLLLFLCPFGISMVYGVQHATWTAAAIGATVVAWSFVCRPQITGTRDEVSTREENGTPTFSSRWRGIAQLGFEPVSKISAFIFLFLAIGFLGKHFSNVALGFGPILGGIYAVSGCYGEAAAKGVRAARQLPLSSRALTIALHVQGLFPALALLLPMGFMNPPDPVNLALLLAAAFFLTAVSAASIWTPFYPNQSGVAIVLFLIFLFTVFGILTEINEPVPKWQIALTALLVSVPLFAAVAQSIDREFWWDSKVYRHPFQHRQRSFRLNSVSAADEELMLTVAFIVGLLGALLSILIIVGGIT